jgi:DNA-binding transcriptional LysR family regulator
MFLRELSEFSLQSLRVFSYVATLGSVAEAADALSLTQPAVSLQIGNLEKLLGFNLFERQGRKNVITSRGLSFLQRLLPQLEKLEQVVVESKDQDNMSKAKLEIGSVQGIGEFWLSRRFHEFSDKQKDVRIFLDIAENKQLEDMLITGRVSVIITTNKVEHAQITSQLLLNERLLPVGRKGAIEELRALVENSKRGDRFWQKVRWIGYGDPLNIDLWPNRWLENMGTVVDRRIRFAHKVNSYSVIKQLLLEDKGVCVAPEHTCERELSAGDLVALESKKYPAIKNKLYLSFREASLSRIHEDFVTWILKIAARDRES